LADAGSTPAASTSLSPDFMGLSGWGKALFYRPRIVPSPFLPAKLCAPCDQFSTRFKRAPKQ
jgi:hypothetical protein